MGLFPSQACDLSTPLPRNKDPITRASLTQAACLTSSRTSPFSLLSCWSGSTFPRVRSKPRAIHPTIAPFSPDLFFDLFSVCLFFWGGREEQASLSLVLRAVCLLLLLLCGDFRRRGSDFSASLGDLLNFLKTCWLWCYTAADFVC